MTLARRGSEKGAQTIGHQVGKQPHQRSREAKYENDRSRNAQHRSSVRNV
jgi:hypothetical protein